MKHNFMIIAILIGLWSCSSEKPTGKTPAEVLYKEAQVLIEKGRYLQATEKLGQIRAQYPYSYFATHAELLQADVHFKQSSYVESAAAYIMFKDFHPRHPQISYVIWQIAESFFLQMPSTYDRDLGPAEEAIKYYQIILRDYPNSEYVPKAQERLLYCQNMLEQHEKYVADFYFKTSEFDAAIFRYKHILDNMKDPNLIQHSMKRIVEASMKQKDFLACVNYINSFYSSASAHLQEELSNYKVICQNKIVHKAD